MKAVAGTSLKMIRLDIRRVQSVQRPMSVVLVEMGHDVVNS